MARITLCEERFGTKAKAYEYQLPEAGDILYFPVSPGSWLTTTVHFW